MYYTRALNQPGGSAVQFSNGIPAAIRLGRFDVADSLGREFVRRFPNNPVGLRVPAMIAASRGEIERAEQLAKEIESRIAGSLTGMIQQLWFISDLAMARGRVREALHLKEDARKRGAQPGQAVRSRLDVGLDSAMAAAAVLEDLPGARAVFERTLRRAPIDSVPFLDRDYWQYLLVAALVQDTARAREFHAGNRKSWEDTGDLLDRPTGEAIDDALLATVLGRHADAIASIDRAGRLPILRPDILEVRRFMVFDRAQQVDSAIASGERYLAMPVANREYVDAHFRAGVLQRLGEMYEAKGNVDKALTHYNAFVELWKNADPELQPRVRDVRGRIERLQRRRG
jgi:tetratricopeptide (TPR) repeat protein